MKRLLVGIIVTALFWGFAWWMFVLPDVENSVVVYAIVIAPYAGFFAAMGIPTSRK